MSASAATRASLRPPSTRAARRRSDTMERETGFEPATPSLEGWRSTAELFPPDRWWGGEDLNPRRRTPADLQSAPFGHLGTSPNPPARAPNPLKSWRWREDLNPRPTAYKAVALPLSYASTDKTSL